LGIEARTRRKARKGHDEVQRIGQRFREVGMVEEQPEDLRDGRHQERRRGRQRQQGHREDHPVLLVRGMEGLHQGHPPRPVPHLNHTGGVKSPHQYA